MAALAIPQRQHIAVAEAVEGDGLAVARQRLQMAGDRAGVPVQTEAVHRGGIERDGQPLRFIEQREGERILGARRRRGGAVTHRQRGVCVQPFCAGGQRRQQVGLGGGVVAVQADSDLLRLRIRQLQRAVMATAQAQRQAIRFLFQTGGLPARGVHPGDRLQNAGAECVVRGRLGGSGSFHRG